MLRSETSPENPFREALRQIDTPDYTADGEVPDLDQPREGEDLIPLFRLDGRTYSIPADPAAGFALKYLAGLKRGVMTDAAAAVLLEDVLGEEAFAALSTSPKVRMSDFVRIMEIVKTRVLGPAMDALGK
jgi:hypothetical protein